MKTARLILRKIKEKKPKILVIGDIMLDKFIYGNVNRISPEAPIPIVDYVDERKMLGGCGNVVKNLVNIGVDASIISVIGRDLSGRIIKDLLLDIDVPISSLLEVKESPTTVKTRIIGDNQQLVRIDRDINNNFFKNEHEMLEVILKVINRFDAVIISDYAKGVCSKLILEGTINAAMKHSVPVFVDPKGINWNVYKKAQLITPNQKEAELILKRELVTDKDFEIAGKDICKKYSIDRCLITRGSDGMSMVNKDESLHIKSKAKEIFDVSGAGDTVIAAITIAIVLEYSYNEACEFANQAAGIVVGHIGTHAITYNELEH